MYSPYKGKFCPKNPQKYVGDSTNIIYRSLLELRFMKKCDEETKILQWASEEVIVPYISPLDNRPHRYFPDFIIKTLDRTDTIKMKMIEIKPDKQTKPPVIKKNMRKKRIINEVKTWEVNKAKWMAAKDFCAERGWEFVIVTEKHLQP